MELRMELRMEFPMDFPLVFRRVFLAVCAVVYGSFTPGLGTTTTPLARACFLVLTSAQSTGFFSRAGRHKIAVFSLP
jgi:hypothetical protein